MENSIRFFFSLHRSLCIIYHLSQALAGTRGAYRAGENIICACIHEICFFRDFMGLKRQNFPWSLLTQHLYTRQLACEPQTGSLAYFSVVVRDRTKKTTSSLDPSSPSSNMQAAAFAVPLCKDNSAKSSW